MREKGQIIFTEEFQILPADTSPFLGIAKMTNFGFVGPIASMNRMCV